MKPRRIQPGPDQESVWDYPRPPRLEPVTQHIRILLQDRILADSNRAYRVLETSHPPVYYLPPEDFDAALLVKNPRTSFCEFKGRAAYIDLKLGEELYVAQAGWYYPNPTPAFVDITNYVAIYAHKVSECWVGEEKVQPQEGDFYGGWITSKVVGPFKGGAGTWGW